MNANKRTARIVGILFLIATAAGVLSTAFLPLLDSSATLDTIAAGTNMPMATLLIMVMVAAGVGIGAMMFPVLKRQHEGAALGYAGIKVIEAVFTLIAQVALLSLWSVSQESVTVGTADAVYGQTLGAALLAVQHWAILLGVSIFFPAGALLLNSLLYQSRLVPRWLAAWGMAGAALYLVWGLLVLFGVIPQHSATEMLWALPIAVQEMALAVWLIAKGFTSPEAAAGPALPHNQPLPHVH